MEAHHALISIAILAVLLACLGIGGTFLAVVAGRLVASPFLVERPGGRLAGWAWVASSHPTFAEAKRRTVSGEPPTRRATVPLLLVASWSAVCVILRWDPLGALRWLAR